MIFDAGVLFDHLVEALDACDEPQLLHYDSLNKFKGNPGCFALVSGTQPALTRTRMKTGDTVKT
ncbi:MAG: hypothetical protein ACXWXT_04850, partial [Candidatus Binatia bacterium]